MAGEGQPGRYRHRRTTLANRENEVIPLGELVIEEDTNQLWRGDGVTAGGLLIADMKWMTTGILDGGDPSIASATTVDVTAALGVIVDKTNPLVPTYTFITKAATTITLTNIATEILTNIALDSGGNYVQTSGDPDHDDYTDLIQVFRAGHRNLTSISSVSSRVFPAYDIGGTIRDTALAATPKSLSGNDFSAASTDLTIFKSVGTSHAVGRGYLDDKNTPNRTIDAELDPATFTRVWDDGTGIDISLTPGQTDIDPGNYDDGTGTLASVPASKWTVQKVLYGVGSNSVGVFYGRALYNNSADALVAAATEVVQSSPDTGGLLLRYYLVVRGNATDLSDTATAIFREALVGGSGGSGGAVGDMQKSVYDPTTVEADTFDMANMLESAGEKILTSAERTNIASGVTHRADTTKHRLINDAGTATTELWSADKIITELALKVDTADVSATPGTADAIVQADGSGDLSLAWHPDMSATEFVARAPLAGTGPPTAISAANAFLNIFSGMGANSLAATGAVAGLGTYLAVGSDGIIGRSGTGPLSSVSFAEGDVMARLTGGNAQMENLKDLLLDAAVDFGPRFVIMGEETSNMSTGVASGYQYSFGNGATNTGIGTLVLASCELEAFGIIAGNSLNTSTFAMRKNGTGGSDLSTLVLAGTNRVNYTTGLSASGAAGDVITGYTKSTAGTLTGPHVWSAMFRLT